MHRTTTALLAAFLIALFAHAVHGQQLPKRPTDTLDPSIVVLMPGRLEVDAAMRGKMNATTAEFRRQTASNLAEASSRLAAMRKHPDDFAKVDSVTRYRLEHADELATEVYRTVDRVGYTAVLALYADSYIKYYLSDQFPNALVQFMTDSSTLDTARLVSAARRIGVRYVVSFPMVRIGAIGNKPFAVIRGALYDSQTGEFLFDTTMTTTGENHGFETTCKTGIECTIANAVGIFAPAAATTIVLHTATVKFEMELARSRSQVLIDDYYGRPCSPRVAGLVPRDSTMPDISALYACFANSDTTKIVALMAEHAARPIVEKKDRYGDRNVTVIQDFKDLDHISNVYAFILTGALVDGRWYFAKQHVTYFTADSLEAGRRTYFTSLQRYNFFIEDKTKPNPGFWEAGLFERVEDPRLRKDYDSTRPYFRDMLERDGRYIGMYRFVAEQLERAAEENQTFENFGR